MLKEQEQTAPSRARKRLRELDEDDCSEDEEELAAKVSRKEGFTAQGETVAVYFDNKFYVGEVLDVKEGGGEAVISFLAQVRNQNVFVWPQKEDIADIQARFVLVWDVQMKTTNGRNWFTENFTTLYNKKLPGDCICLPRRLCSVNELM